MWCFCTAGPVVAVSQCIGAYFDPQRYRIVLFDQRGCGRSDPHADLTDNTTWHLVADIETIREELGIARWVAFGGSWGSTLALAYAETHPERVLGLILRGIFLGRPRDVRWFYQEGANHLFPDAWEQFIEPIPELERGDLLSAYHRRLTGPDELERLRVAKHWAAWEGGALTLEQRTEVVDSFTEAHKALSIARIESHYFVHDCFLEPDQLLRDSDRLSGLPGYIVHGRYDVVTPLDNAWQLHHAWPGAELRIIGAAGHAASEPGIVDALITATRSLARRLQ